MDTMYWFVALNALGRMLFRLPFSALVRLWLLIFIGCGRAFGYSPATCPGEVRGRFKYQPPHLLKWRYFQDAVASRYGRALPARLPPCS
jgi:hypothetical protein